MPSVRVLLVLLCFFLASIAHAQEKPDAPKPNKKILVTGVSLLAAAKTADAITTRQLLDRGGWENNSAFGHHPSPAKQAGINLAFFASESAVFYLTERNRHSWVRWAGRAFLAHSIADHAHAAACNAGLNPGLRVTQSCGPLIGVYWF